MTRKADPHWLIDYSHLREQGLTDRQIAAKLGISKDALDQRFRRMNRKPADTTTLTPVCGVPHVDQVGDLVERSLEDAADVITRIREEDPQALWLELSLMPPERLLTLIYTLAAMVPENRPMSQLLAWTNHLAEAS